MIKLMQAELYRIRKNRLCMISIILSTFFMLAFSTTFHYNQVQVLWASGNELVVSLNEFTAFLFSDYSLMIPVTMFLAAFIIDDYEKGLHGIARSKGITRMNFVFGKLIVSCIFVTFYLLFNIGMAYLFLVPFIINRYTVDYFLPGIAGYVLLQLLCFAGYTCFLWMASCIIRVRALVYGLILVLSGTLYLYLNKLSEALELSYSLYHYWILGLSHSLEFISYEEHLPQILMTISLYVMVPILVIWLAHAKADWRRLGGGRT